MLEEERRAGAVSSACPELMLETSARGSTSRSLQGGDADGWWPRVLSRATPVITAAAGRLDGTRDRAGLRARALGGACGTLIPGGPGPAGRGVAGATGRGSGGATALVASPHVPPTRILRAHRFLAFGH